MSKPSRVRKNQKPRRRPASAPATQEQSLRTQLGLSDYTACEILVVGSGAFCSFIKARLSRLGYSDRIGVTSGKFHAQEAIRAEKPWLTIIDLNLNVRSGGVDLAATIQNESLETSLVLIATRFDDRAMRDLAYKMSDEWSVVARRATDNGDPLESAMDAAREGRAWLDSSIRAELQSWRTGGSGTAQLVDRQPVI